MQRRLDAPKSNKAVEALTKEPRALNFQNRKNVGLGVPAEVGQQVIRATSPPGELAQARPKSPNSLPLVTTQAEETRKIRRGPPPETNKPTEPGLVLLGARSPTNFPSKLLHQELVVALKNTP
jgi:hypothetical protein